LLALVLTPISVLAVFSSWEKNGCYIFVCIILFSIVDVIVAENGRYYVSIKLFFTAAEVNRC